MADQEFQPTESGRDFLAWNNELPYELRIGYRKDADPLDELIRAELADHNRELIRVVEGLGRLGLGLGMQASHTLSKPEGYALLGVTNLTESDSYNSSQAMLVIFAEVVNDVFAPINRRDVHLENYFIDCERSLITWEAEDVSVQDYEMPKGAPYMYWRYPSGVQLEHGEGHTIILPSNDPMNYDKIHASRLAMERLESKLTGFDISTLDD